MAAEAVRAPVSAGRRRAAHPTGPRRNAARVAMAVAALVVLARRGARAGSRGIAGGLAGAAGTGAFDADRARAAIGGSVQAAKGSDAAARRRAGTTPTDANGPDGASPRGKTGGQTAREHDQPVARRQAPCAKAQRITASFPSAKSFGRHW